MQLKLWRQTNLGQTMNDMLYPLETIQKNADCMGTTTGQLFTGKRDKYVLIDLNRAVGSQKAENYLYNYNSV